MMEYVSAVNVSPLLASLPTLLLTNRQETSLFRWSFDSSVHVGMVVMGDLLMANASLPPALGFAGASLLGTGLLLAGVQPSHRSTLCTAAWLASACCGWAFAAHEAAP